MFSHSRASFCACAIWPAFISSAIWLRQLLASFAAAQGREIEPFVGGDIILRHALAGGIGQTQIVERIGAPKLGLAFILRQ